MTFAISPPNVFIFQANLSVPHSALILPKFSVISPVGFSITTDPLFCSPKNQVLPPPLPKKIIRPPTTSRPAINNDQPVGTSEIIFWHLNMALLKREDSWYAVTLKVIHLRSHWQKPSAIDDHLVHVSSTSAFFLSALYIRHIRMKIVGSPLACMCNASHTSNLEKKTKYNTVAVY